MKTKILALYLPQYHRIKENDEWWGEGFTEWVNVKKAKKYSRYQQQPRIPLNSNYYDLSDYKVLAKQAVIAKKYGIDGFCFYHYYSCGKKLLETPAELFLKHQEINIHFCFSWANHDWRRTWAAFNNEILRKQEYGSHKEIEEHFVYLLPFFKDDRYIKIENRPVFCIYQILEIEKLKEIKRIFNQKAKENGFAGIYFVETLSGKKTISQEFEGHFCFEPNYSNAVSNNVVWKISCKIKRKLNYALKKINNQKYVVQQYDYHKAIKRIRKTVESICNSKVFPGIFPGWDNTPRHGVNGSFYKGQSPSEFQNLLSRELALCKERNIPFIFINSWNEWGEGAYIEPDENNKYAYLEAVRNAKKLRV